MEMLETRKAGVEDLSELISGLPPLNAEDRSIGEVEYDEPDESIFDDGWKYEGD